MTETHIWAGDSDKTYTYYIKTIDFDFEEKQDGNYIFCKLVNGNWTPLYIGEGDLKDRTQFRINDGCVIRKGASHIHAHLNSSNRARLDEEDDLLENHPESYAPTGCNIRKGG